MGTPRAPSRRPSRCGSISKQGAVRRLALRLRVVLAVAAFAPAVSAQPATEPPGTHAERMKDEADLAMRALRYAEALALYQKSYAILPNPALLYNQGRALEALSRYPEALDQLEKFVGTAPEELKAKVPFVGELIEEMRAKVSTLVVVSNVPGARVLVRSRAVGVTPFPRPLRFNAGEALIEVTAEGYHPFKQSVLLPGRDTLTLEARLVAKATTGVLAVTATVPGAEVFIDGKRVGTVPAELRVERGRHRVVVRAEGHEEADTTAEVAAGARKDLRIQLEPTPPLTARWWFWTGAGVAVAGGVAVFIAMTTERDPGEGDLDPGQVPFSLVRF